MQEKTKEIATIKQAVRLQQWSEQVQEQQASGLSIKQWCDENGIKTNTYYARLKRILFYGTGFYLTLTNIGCEQLLAGKSKMIRAYHSCVQ